MRLENKPGFPTLLQNFFLQHLTAQKGVSPRTIQSYRDAFRLLFAYVEREKRKRPSELELADLDAPLIVRFLDSLEKKRGNCARTRNVRLAAIKSFMRYAAGRDVAALPIVQRTLAIPAKRYDKPLLGFLSSAEMDAVLAGPQRTSWIGERDFVLMSTAYNTGARVSELVNLNVEDVEVERAPSVRIMGKGRKLRQIPLWKSTAALLRGWIRRCAGTGTSPVFPNRHGGRMTRSNVEKRLKLAVRVAAQRCPSLASRKISPHTLRHTTAMHLLQSNVDLATIALWLGHASPATTHGYVEADLAMKQRALDKLDEPKSKLVRFRAPDRLLAFLEGL